MISVYLGTPKQVTIAKEIRHYIVIDHRQVSFGADNPPPVPVTLIAGVPIEELKQKLRDTLDLGMLITSMRSVKIWEEESEAYTENPEYYHTALRFLADVTMEGLQSTGNCPVDTLEGIEHTLDNWHVFSTNPGINAWKNKAKGIPGILVAAGPSLDKNLAQLHNVHAVTMAVDTTFKILLNEGILPTGVTTLERVDAIRMFFEGLPPQAFEETVLVAPPVLKPDVLSIWTGPMLSYMRGVSHYGWWGREDMGTVGLGISGANVAFQVLRHMGCDPIILVGQDLAYGEGEKTHATGTTTGDSQPHFVNSKKRAIEVPGWGGDTVLTHPGWNSMRHQLESDIFHTEAAVFNCTEGGAFIHGAIHTPLAEVAKAWCSEPIDELKAGLLADASKQMRNGRKYRRRMMTRVLPGTLNGQRKAIHEFKDAGRRLHTSHSSLHIHHAIRHTQHLVDKWMSDHHFFTSTGCVLQHTLSSRVTRHHEIAGRSLDRDTVLREQKKNWLRTLTDIIGLTEKANALYEEQTKGWVA